MTKIIQIAEYYSAEYQLLSQLKGYALQRREGDKAKYFAQALYRELTGDFSKLQWDAVGASDPSAAVLRKIRAAQIRFAKGRGKARAAA